MISYDQVVLVAPTTSGLDLEGVVRAGDRAVVLQVAVLAVPQGEAHRVDPDVVGGQPVIVNVSEFTGLPGPVTLVVGGWSVRAERLELLGRLGRCRRCRWPRPRGPGPAAPGSPAMVSGSDHGARRPGAGVERGVERVAASWFPRWSGRR